MDNMDVNNAGVKSMEVTGSGKGLMVAAIIGGTVFIGGIVYKYVIKPLAAKHRAKKAKETSEPGAPVEVDQE